MSHLQLHLKVRDSAQPAQQRAGTPKFGVGHGQPLKAINLYISQLVGCLTNLSHAVLNGKERSLIGVAKHGHDHPIEEVTASLDDIEVTKGDGVKASGINGNHTKWKAVCMNFKGKAAENLPFYSRS